jgi:hypothetical protein
MDPGYKIVKPCRLYIADSECGLVKIGITRSPQARAKDLVVEFRHYNAKMRRIFFFNPVNFGHTIEALSIQQFQSLVPRYKREWFRGLDYELAKEFIRGLVAAERARFPVTEMRRRIKDRK